MNRNIKNFILESENDKNENFIYIDNDVIDNISNVEFNKEDNYIKLNFFTTYGKELCLVVFLDSFLKWFKDKEKNGDVFKDYIIDFFQNSQETKNLNEIIDDTNEIMPDDDLPSNSSNRMVGTNQNMDLEKIFKRSMPKSVRNYSGNLGLGTVVW
jgi:hypothetical protein